MCNHVIVGAGQPFALIMRPSPFHRANHDLKKHMPCWERCGPFLHATGCSVHEAGIPVRKLPSCFGPFFFSLFSHMLMEIVH